MTQEIWSAELLSAELECIDGAAICAARDRFLQGLAESYFNDDETEQERGLKMDEVEADYQEYLAKQKQKQEEEDEIERAYKAHQDSGRDEQDLYCPPPPLEDDVELLDAPDGEGD